MCVLTPCRNVALVTAQVTVANAYVSPCSGVAHLSIAHSTLEQKRSTVRLYELINKGEKSNWSEYVLAVP